MLLWNKLVLASNMLKMKCCVIDVINFNRIHTIQTLRTSLCDHTLYQDILTYTQVSLHLVFVLCPGEIVCNERLRCSYRGSAVPCHSSRGCWHCGRSARWFPAADTRWDRRSTPLLQSEGCLLRRLRTAAEKGTHNSTQTLRRGRRQETKEL